jgi:flavocytochrome c
MRVGIRHRARLASAVLIPLLLASVVASEQICCQFPDTHGCVYAAVDRLADSIDHVADTSYFQLFHLPSDRECPFWKHEGDTSAHSSCASESETEPALCTVSTEAGRFDWEPSTDTVDRSISQREDELLSSTRAGTSECDETDLPEFWLDMCGAIDDSEAHGEHVNREFVSLRKNPERWTGFNGSTIWRAMYEENCFQHSAVDNLCYEERVLYRLLSGMHSSINIHISLNFYAPRKGKRASFEPNPERFQRQFSAHPDRLENLHFAFTVLLRAIDRASPFFSLLPLDRDAAEKLNVLLEHVHQSSCDSSLPVFDESELFSRDTHILAAAAKRNFKNIFMNISTLFDCISCQQCKLHGKLQLLGVGTALKLLLSPLDMISVSRQESVALFNTLAKFSQAIVASRDFLLKLNSKPSTVPSAIPPPPSPRADPAPLDIAQRIDTAIALVKQLASLGRLNSKQERLLLKASLLREPGLLSLAWHYRGDTELLAELLPSSASALAEFASSSNSPQNPNEYDAIVIGGGLSGLVCAIRVAERGGRVLLLEKEAFLGGNSAWASSGINAALSDDPGPVVGVPNAFDSAGLYRSDTLRSASLNESALIDALTGASGDALLWLRSHGISFPLRGLLGGHSAERTYRPSSGLAGTELIRTLTRISKLSQFSGRVEISKKSRVTEILRDGGRISGCVFVGPQNDKLVEQRAYASSVVIATGGFAASRGSGSLMSEYRPDLLHLSTTNGGWATGDGIRLARSLGAELVDMEHVQVHPTAFVRQALRESAAASIAEPSKGESEKPRTLCAEILRGVGGILLDQTGNVFVDPLQTRKHIVSKMLEHSASLRAQDGSAARPIKPDEFVLLLGSNAAKSTSHVALYSSKSLLLPLDTLAQVAAWMGVEEHLLIESVRAASPALLDDAPFYVGIVGPALHYTMGGIRINTNGQALDAHGHPIDGLYAVGEVSGGIHGANRLGGNSLTECVVFGLAAGNVIPLKQRVPHSQQPSSSPAAAELREINAHELAQHASESSCWIALHGHVYDFTTFLEEHPAGAEPLLEVAGSDATARFDSVHSKQMLEDFTPIGTLVN